MDSPGIDSDLSGFLCSVDGNSSSEDECMGREKARLELREVLSGP